MIHYFGVFDPGPFVRNERDDAPAKAALYEGGARFLSWRFWTKQFSRLG